MTRWTIAAGAALAFLLVTAPVAFAIDRDCPRGQVWDPNQGACIKKKRNVRKLSPEQKYYQAIEHLEGTARRADPQKGVALLEDSCRAKHGPACTLLGFLYLNGRTVEADATRSLQFYRGACDLGDPHGCLGAADVHGRGLLGKVDHAAAIALLDKACALGNGKGCHQLGERYHNAVGVAADLDRARTLYAQAFELLSKECPGNGPSCYLLGRSLLNGLGVTEDEVRAVWAFEEGCKSGSGDACLALAQAHNFGWSMPIDKPRAFEQYDKACARYDNATACHDAGIVMINSDEVAIDAAVLARLGERACELDRRHCELLGYIYATGAGGTQNHVQGTMWYLASCEAGNEVACDASAWRHWEGTGTRKDGPRAAQLWQRSCDLGHAGACTQMAKRYYNGEGVPEDVGQAYELMALGCQREHPEGCHLLGTLYELGKDGTGVAKPLDAVAAYALGCDVGSADACDAAGDLLLTTAEGLERDPNLARNYYGRGCDQGKASSCTDLGHLHDRGEGGDRDPLAAADAYRRACDAGGDFVCFWIDSELQEADGVTAEHKSQALATLQDACSRTEQRNEYACYALGALYATGGTIAGKDEREAFGTTKSSCDRGFAETCVQLALFYINGTGVVPDPAEAKRLLTAQCNRDNAGACTWLGHQLWQEGDHEGSLPLFRRACDAGSGEACNSIGFAHYTAKGVRWDVATAADHYEKACEHGSLIGCANVGELLENGIARTRDLPRALEHYQKACTPNQVAGCAAVGRFYARGLGGVEVDLDRAQREFERACNDQWATSAEACRDLAIYYREHDKAPASKVASLMQKAFDLARQSAEQNPYGRYQLGIMYRDGLSVKRNADKAAEQFVLACKGYDPLGCMAAGRIYSQGEGIAADHELAAVQFDRACAAQVEAACESAARARQQASEPGETVPLAAPKGAGGCACRGPADPSGAAGFLLLAMLVAAAIRRRRG